MIDLSYEPKKIFVRIDGVEYEVAERKPEIDEQLQRQPRPEQARLDLTLSLAPGGRIVDYSLHPLVIPFPMKPRNLSQLRLYPGLYVLVHRTSSPILRGKIDEVAPVRGKVAAIGVETSIEPLPQREGVRVEIPFENSGLVRRASAEHNRFVGFPGQYRMKPCRNGHSAHVTPPRPARTAKATPC